MHDAVEECRCDAALDDTDGVVQVLADLTYDHGPHAGRNFFGLYD
ncbi:MULTISPECIES: hypothetical protein [Kribbella]|nr:MULTISPECIES: hypothetical protein [Kribbella]